VEPEERSQLAVLGGALVLGVVQGLTEFLPVSSSGHFVMFEQFLPVGEQHILFILVLHIGTLVPVLWFYRETLLQMIKDPFAGGDVPLMERDGVRMGLLVILASIPTAIIGLLFEDFFDALFSSPETLTLTFAITGVLLLITRQLASGEYTLKTLPLHYGLVLGVAQGLAITPGISRSGTTIAVALMLGLKRDFAARYSFLMSVPAIAGGTLLKTLKADSFEGMDAGGLFVGGLSSLIVGYFALALLVKLVKDGNLHYFAWYCFAASAAAGFIAFAA
jgi:undecaprenyl-diphosphatase